MTEKQTTKYCPSCGNTNLILIRSQNHKYCSDCDTKIDWFLDENQQPLICSNRFKHNEENNEKS
jgi:endogenous inhibitor of DNA gyrase (YacG/DUF329 family)